MKQIAIKFREELRRAREGKKSSLKYLNSYLSQPTGEEQGEYLALDFGGTKVKIVLFHLLGNRHYLKLKEDSFLLKTADYDYTQGKSQDLFIFLALKIKEFLPDKRQYFLGHTFSFPFTSLNSRDGVLLNWTKEFKVEGVIGQNINSLLNNAFLSVGVKNVKAVALLNDTIAVLLAGRYAFANCVIGSVIGTGFNCGCFHEGQAVNLECGNFNLIEQDKYDALIDEQSENKGQQIIEKMISGCYLGERARLIYQEEFFTEAIKEPFSFSTADLSQVIAKNEANDLWEICQKVLDRSADLAAACYQGILAYLNNQGEQAVLIDGSVFLKAPGYKERLITCLADQVHIYSLSDSSALGGAIGASLAEK